MAGGWCSMVRLQSHTKGDNFFVFISMHLNLYQFFRPYVMRFIMFHRVSCSFHFCSESTSLTVCQCCLDQKVGASEIHIRDGDADFWQVCCGRLQLLSLSMKLSTRLKTIQICRRTHDTSWYITSLTSAIDLEIYSCSCQSHLDPGRESDPFLKKRACVVLQGRTLGRTFSKACITNHKYIICSCVLIRIL